MQKNQPEPSNPAVDTNHTDTDDSGEIEIVPLDAPETPVAQPGKSGLRFSRRVRLGMGLFTGACCLLLLTMLWPTLSPYIHLPTAAQSAATPISASTPLFSSQPIHTHITNIFSTDTVTYISTSPSDQNSSYNLYAVRSSDGYLFWHYDRQMLSPPVFDNNILYIPTVDGIDAIHANDHAVLWHSTLPLSFLRVANGVLYGRFSTENTLYTLDASNGKVLWQKTNNPVILQIDTKGGVIYTGPTEISSNQFTVLRISDGVTLWQHTITHNGFPHAGDAVVCLDSSEGDSIDVLRASDGTLLWHKDGMQCGSGPQNGLIYTTDVGKTSINALRASDGTLLWHDDNIDGDTLQQSDLNLTPFPITDGIFFAHSTQDANIIAIRGSDGRILWHYPAPAILREVSNGLVCIIPTHNPILNVVHASDGRLFWHSSVEGAYHYIEHAHMYLFSPGNDTVTALNITNGSVAWRYKLPPPPESLTPTNIHFVVTVVASYVPRQSYQPNNNK